MKVLIIGGSSLLGRYLTLTIPEGTQVSATWYTNLPRNSLPVSFYQLDVCNVEQTSYILGRVQPDVIIHCAAIGSVDWAETHYAEARRVIVDGTASLARLCERERIRLVYISSNAVFSGQEPPYAEDARRAPINRYGSLKMQAEDEATSGRDWIVIRPYLLYGWPYPGGRGNWAMTVSEKLDAGLQVRAVADVLWQPTYALDCAEAIWTLALGETRQVYHVAAEGKHSLYDYALTVAAVFSLDASLIIKAYSDDFKSLAPRPWNTAYKLDKLHGLGLRCRGLEEGLVAMRGRKDARQVKAGA